MYCELETVALTRSVPEYCLEAGDVGAVVHIYPDAATLEVEFVTSAGDTVAVLTLAADAVRHRAGAEILHVRPLAVL